MNDEGKIVQPPAPTPAPAPEDDVPTLDETPIGPKGARTQEQKDAQTARAEAGRAQMLDWIKAGLNGPVYLAKAYIRKVGEAYTQIANVVPSEEERTATAFRAMLKKGSYRATEDTFMLLNNFIASGKGTEKENAKAQKMIKAIGDKLGIEQTPEGL
jgi:hypothetical protein